MVEQFQTSFIPKKVTETPRQESLTGQGLTLFLGVILLVISLLLAGGVFAYEAYLNNAIVRKKEQLAQQREAFAPELIRDMARLSKKLETADKLLRNHVSVSAIFELLQQTTLKTIRFNSFNFTNTDKGIQVTLQGEGLSFTSIALQADEFAKNPNLSNSLFSGFSLNQIGNVSFSVSTLVNPKVITYSENLGNRGSANISVQNAPSSPDAPLDAAVPGETGTTTDSTNN